MANSPFQSFMQGLSSFFSSVRHPVRTTGAYFKRIGQSHIKAQEINQLIKDSIVFFEQHGMPNIATPKAVRENPAQFKAFIEIVKSLGISANSEIQFLWPKLWNNQTLKAISKSSHTAPSHAYLDAEIGALTRSLTTAKGLLTNQQLYNFIIYTENPIEFLPKLTDFVRPLWQEQPDLHFLQSSNFKDSEKLEMLQELKQKSDNLITDSIAFFKNNNIPNHESIATPEAIRANPQKFKIFLEIADLLETVDLNILEKVWEALSPHIAEISSSKPVDILFMLKTLKTSIGKEALCKILIATQQSDLFFTQLSTLIPQLTHAAIDIQFLKNSDYSDQEKLDIIHAMLRLNEHKLLTLDIQKKLISGECDGLSRTKFSTKLIVAQQDKLIEESITLFTQKMPEGSPIPTSSEVMKRSIKYKALIAITTFLGPTEPKTLQKVWSQLLQDTRLSGGQSYWLPSYTHSQLERVKQTLSTMENSCSKEQIYKIMANTKNLFVFLYEVADIIPVLIAANINLSFLEDPLPSTSYKLEMANAMLLLHKAELLTLDVKDKILTSDRGGLTPKKFAEKLKAEKPPEASPPAITFSTQRSHDKSHTSEAETANPLKETSYKGTKLQ